MKMRHSSEKQVGFHGEASPELQKHFSLLASLTRKELWILVDKIIRLLDPSAYRKIDRAVDRYLTTRARLEHGESGKVVLRLPPLGECMAYVRYYYLRKVKPGDRDKVLNAYRPLLRRVRHRVKERLRYHRRKGSLDAYLARRH